MSHPIVPGNDSPGVGYLGAPVTSPNGRGVARTRDSEPEGESQACNRLALALLVTAELAFVFAAILWARLTTAEALQAAAGATMLGLLAYYGRAMLVAVGKRVLNNGHNGN